MTYRKPGMSARALVVGLALGLAWWVVMGLVAYTVATS